MNDQLHTQILHRAGGILLAVGLIDLAVMVYCIVNRVSYASSFNLFAVLAGFFLMRGSLRAASIVRWFAIFMLAALLALIAAWPFMQPAGLLLAMVRINPVASAVTVALAAFVLALLFWLIHELGRKPVLAAHTLAGRKLQNACIPASAGLGLVVVVAIFMSVLLGSEAAHRARALAEQQSGPGFQYHVSSLSIAKNSRGTFVSGVVAAWNEKEIRYVPVQWEER